MRAESLFLIRFVFINMFILLTVIYFLLENLPVPLTSESFNNLKQMDVLGVQASSVQSIPNQTNLSFELSKHDIPADCWIEYSGHFYDITMLLNMDNELAEYCGQDATLVLDSKDPSKPLLHSVEVRRMISQFLIQ